MIQVSITKLYAACVALMVLIPITSFNSTTGRQELSKESDISKKIKIEKIKIDLELKRATYSEGLSQTY